MPYLPRVQCGPLSADAPGSPCTGSPKAVAEAPTGAPSVGTARDPGQCQRDLLLFSKGDLGLAM